MGTLLDESFFTTKPQGQGSEPELPECKQIVEDPNGADETASEPRTRRRCRLASRY